MWVWLPWGVLDTTLCDKVCQWLATGRWFSTGTRISFNNKTERHDTTEISLEVALNTINQTKPIHVDVESILSDKSLSVAQIRSMFFYRYCIGFFLLNKVYSYDITEILLKSKYIQRNMHIYFYIQNIMLKISIYYAGQNLFCFFYYYDRMCM